MFSVSPLTKTFILLPVTVFELTTLIGVEESACTELIGNKTSASEPIAAIFNLLNSLLPFNNS